jgi:predicted ArsR family transcriptional regulator
MDLGHADVVKNVGAAGELSGREGLPALPGAALPSAALPRGTPPGGPPPALTQAGTERGTRGQVARLILELGPATAAVLGSRLGLTPAAIRRHLDNLIAEGMVESQTARTYGNRGRGRPARLFVITDEGRSAFEHAYDGLATSALRFVAERMGDQAVGDFARSQIAELERRYAPVVTGELGARVQALAEALNADGYAASVRPAPAIGMARAEAARPGTAGEQLCQHHCPVAHVAAEFPQLCEAETEAFGRLLGTPVQRLATIAHGDGVCTTHVTRTSVRDAVDATGRTTPLRSPEDSPYDDHRE